MEEALREEEDRVEDALLEDLLLVARGALVLRFLSAKIWLGDGVSTVACSMVGVELGEDVSWFGTLSKANTAEPVRRTITRSATLVGVFERAL